MRIVERIRGASSKQLLRKRPHQNLVQNAGSRIVLGPKVKKRCITSTAVRHPIKESVRLGNDGGVNVKPEDVLAKLANHEEKCDLGYQRIEERLDDQKKTLDRLDIRLWGLAALIVGLAIAERFM